LQYLLETPPTYFEVGFDPIFDEQFIEDQEKEGHIFEVIYRKERIPFYEIETHRLWGYTANLTERFIEIIRNHVSD